MSRQTAIRAESQLYNFELNPVPVSFFECTFPSQTPLGLQIIPRHLKYRVSGSRTEVTCCTVISSTRPEILPGDILVHVNGAHLLATRSDNLDEFFAESMRIIREAQDPRTILFSRPSGSSPSYITGLSTALILNLTAEEETVIAPLLSSNGKISKMKELDTPQYETRYPLLEAPSMEAFTRTVTEKPAAPKVEYRNEEDEIEKKVEAQLRAITTAMEEAKIKKAEEASRTTQQQEFERVARLEQMRKDAEEEARSNFERIRAEEQRIIEEARKAAADLKMAEDAARAKRVAETVQRRVEQEALRIAEEQEVTMRVEQELARLNEIKNREDFEARAARVTEEAKRRVAEEMEKIVKREQIQRAAEEELAARIKAEAIKKKADDAKYAADELARQNEEKEAMDTANKMKVEEMKMLLVERRQAAELEVRSMQDVDHQKYMQQQELLHILELDEGKRLVKEAERLAEANQKAEELKAREKRVQEAVQKRIAEEKKKVLDSIESARIEDEAHALAASKKRALLASADISINPATESAEDHKSGQETINGDIVMEQWLQKEVQRRVSEGVKKHVDAAAEDVAVVNGHGMVGYPDMSGPPATFFDTTFPDTRNIGLTFIAHTILFSAPTGVVQSIYCCMISDSAFTADVQQADIAVSVNGMPLTSLGLTGLTAELNLQDAMMKMRSVTTQKTIRFFRASRPISEDGATSSLNLDDATVLMQHGGHMGEMD